MNETSAPLLQVRGLTVSRGRSRSRVGHPVLAGIDLRVEQGECLAVVGTSGAGKSVLARTLLGLTQHEPGWHVTADSLAVAGEQLRSASERNWRRARGTSVSLVLQDALQSLDPLRTVGAEVGETLAIRGVPRGERRSRAIAALNEAGLPNAAARLSQHPGELSGGMRQRALVAAALVGDPAIVIADEPTTALDPLAARRVLDLLGRIRERGAGLVLVSHDLTAVSRIADRVAILEHGRIVETGPAERVLTEPSSEAGKRLVAAIPRGPALSEGPSRRGVGDARTAWRAGDGDGTAKGNRSDGGELIRLEEVSHEFAAPGGGTAGLAPVSFTVSRGDAIGVVGESGAGKSTLARLLSGAIRPSGGKITVADPAPRIRLIPQDPLATFDPRWRVERIVDASRRGRGPSPAELLAQVGIGPELLSRRPITLSGGQRQRVAIARAIAADPDVLVCDEPVSALDTATQAGVLDLLRELQASRGLALVFVSHDLAAVGALCDRVLVLRDGRTVEEGATERVFAHPRDSYVRELVAAASVSPQRAARQ